jgi:hypothetical protein
MTNVRLYETHAALVKAYGAERQSTARETRPVGDGVGTTIPGKPFLVELVAVELTGFIDRA